MTVVGVIDMVAVGQGFSYEPSDIIALVVGNQLTTVIAMLGLFLQVAVEVVEVSSALAVKAGFLLDQAIGVILESVGFAHLIFDLGQQ